MPLPNIKLDERTFQDLVDEAKLRIPRYTPEWTNHNVSDPGVTLIELFAYMVEHLLYQINRVPEKNYRTFLDMIGVKLSPPNAAKGEVAFRLSTYLPNPLLIPKGTEVATVRTEEQTARIYTTDQELVITPPLLKYILTTPNSQTFTNVSLTTLSDDPKPLDVFPENPQPGNAFYLGFDSDIARNMLLIGINSEKLGVGINPKNAPLVWEYWDRLENDWRELETDNDTTGGLTLPWGQVELYVPQTIGQREITVLADTMTASWIRCRYRNLSAGQPAYLLSPKVLNFSARSIGGTTVVSHSQIIKNEDLGRSSGEPGQKFALQNTPVLSLNQAAGEIILVDSLEEGKVPEVWTPVPDFADSKPTDKHFVCDYITGEITFGPALRNPSGVEEQWGAIPPYNYMITIASYRTGGGLDGNVGANSITVLKSSVPYVASVNNRRPITGGTTAESLEHALVRGPRTLRARNRAVTAEDFEVLTREATSGVARVKCLTPGPLDQPSPEDRVEPGTVVLMVIPEVDSELREIRPEHLSLSAGMKLDILDYLDERRLLTTQVELTTPRYQWITIQARIKTSNAYVNERVKREAERRIYRFIRPVNGGPDPTMRYDKPGEGWPFGRILYVSEFYPLLQTIEGVEFIEKIEMFPVNDINRGQAGAPNFIIDPGQRGVLVSYRHQIVII
jgi:predicted phage baseplate assembly protein